MPEALQEPFTLTKGDAAVTSTDGPFAAVWGTIWSYLVPVGIGHIILPGHTLALYAEGTASAVEMPFTGLVRVLIQDASQQDRKSILGPLLYASLRNFTDRDQMARFNVPEPVKVYERQYIIIEWNGDDGAGGGVDQAGAGALGGSWFELSMSRIRQPL